MSFNWSIVQEYWPRYWQGMILTLKYSIIAIVVAIIWGLIVGVIAHRKPPIIGRVTQWYITFFRETPLLVQLYFLFYGVSRYISVPAGFIGVIALVLNDGAFIAEIIRGGLQSLDPGQREAALSLGFTEFQTLRYFLVPQAWTKVMDSLINMMSIIIKDTSMLMWITIRELTYQSNQINIYTFNPITAYAVAAAMYYVLFLIVQGTRFAVRKRSLSSKLPDVVEVDKSVSIQQEARIA